MEKIIFFIRNNLFIIILTQRPFLFSTLNYDRFAQRVTYLPVLDLLEKNSEYVKFNRNPEARRERKNIAVGDKVKDKSDIQ